MTARFAVVQQVAAETGYPTSGISATAFTQIVAQRLHAEDPCWGRRITATGPIGKDTVAYRLGDAPANPFSVAIILGVGGPTPRPHWVPHGRIGGTWLAPGAPRGDERGGAADQLDLSQVTWLHTNVRGWAKTSTITNTSIGDPPICIDHTKRGDWPRVSAGGTTVEGNPWVFAKVDGRWYAATYEWLRPGQECKGISASNIGAHIKVSPLSRWTPQSGETIGLMVSTPARVGPQGPRHERSNVVRVRWP